MSRPFDHYPKTLRKADLEAKAVRAVEKLQKRSPGTQPVVITGYKVATSFWGQAWCEHLEGMADYSNRLPRGRSYVRSGAVVDLQILPGLVKAQVQGSRLYQVEIQIAPCSPSRWQNLVADCSGSIDSVVALLQGQVAPAVIGQLIDPEDGLFPSAYDMRASCSCPDWASLCKHIAATYYGVGARLDTAPELFFLLRQVDQADLFASAAVPFANTPDSLSELSEDLGALFDIALDAEPAPLKTPDKSLTSQSAPAKKTPSRRKNAAKESAAPSPTFATLDLTPRPTISKEEILAAGVSENLIQPWLEAGILRKTRSPGSYRTTPRVFEILRIVLAHQA
ncbi:MAG TPA: SWIM zinc finger family protein [Planctomycetota bacterium]|jgi:uncharacterized Zn finger protein|nr:SWIM zinc finger family protein [Planctomycetota bacterium]